MFVYLAVPCAMMIEMARNLNSELERGKVSVCFKIFI